MQPDSSDSQSVEPRRINAEGLRNQFEDAIHEVEPESDETFWTILIKRPVTCIIILSLIGLIALLGHSASESSLVGRVKQVLEITPQTVNLISADDERIVVRASAVIALNYEKLEEGIQSSLFTFVAGLIGILKFKINDGIDLRANPAGNGFKHLATLGVDNGWELDITPQKAPTVIESEIYLDQLGRDDVIGSVTSLLVTNQPIELQVRAPITITKWGIDYPVDVVWTDKLQLGPFLNYKPNLDSVYIHSSSGNDRGINITAGMSVSGVDNLPFQLRGNFPPLNWTIKLPGCEENSKIPVGEGVSGEVDISSDQDSEIFTSLWSNLLKFPREIVTACPDAKNTKSPLDTLISNYIVGNSSSVYFSAIDNGDILSQILSATDIPYQLEGRSLDEKLVESVEVHDVRMTTVLDDHTSTFSGEAVGNIRLPSLIAINKHTVILAVTKIKGRCDLYGSGDERAFGSVFLENWSQTITLPTLNGYEIQCSFKNTPLKVSDTAKFLEVSENLMLFGEVPIDYEAWIDAIVVTPIGSFSLQEIHLSGSTVLASNIA